MEISDVRKRVRHAIDQAKRDNSDRRARVEAATTAYGSFLTDVAAPVFRMLTAALAAEGHSFTVFTPPDSIRLASGRSGQDFIELSLDTVAVPPVIVGKISRERGRRVVETDRPLHETKGIAQITDEDVLEFLIEALVPFVAR